MGNGEAGLRSKWSGRSMVMVGGVLNERNGIGDC